MGNNKLFLWVLTCVIIVSCSNNTAINEKHYTESSTDNRDSLKREATIVMLDSIQEVANCGCNQLKSDEGIANMFAGFQAMHANRFLADDVLEGEAIDGFYEHLHLCEYLLVFGCEEQWLYDDEFHYLPEVINGYKKYKDSDFLYFADFYRILDRNYFTLTGEVGGYLEEIMSDNQYLEQYEGY